MSSIDTTCQTYFADYLSQHGTPPGRNFMVRALEGKVPAGRIERNWRILMGKEAPPTAAPAPSHADDQPPSAEEPVTSPGEPVDALAVAVAQQHLEWKTLRQEVKDVRALVMDLAPQERAEMVQHVGKIQAHLSLLTTQVQEQSDRLKFLDAAVQQMRAQVEPFQTLRTLLATDQVAWDVVTSMVRHADSWTQHKVVYNWLAAWAGRPLHTPTQ
jgi:hypothetical protein